MSSTLASMTVQLVQNTWRALTNSYLLGQLRVVIEPSIWFNPSVIQF